MMETAHRYRLTASVCSLACYSGSLGFNKVNSSLVNSGLKELTQAIPQTFAIPCFLCCPINTEPSPWGQTMDVGGEVKNSHLGSLLV